MRVFGDDVVREAAAVRRRHRRGVPAPRARCAADRDGEPGATRAPLRPARTRPRGADRLGAARAFASTTGARDFVGTLSGGLQRRAEVAKALLHHPQLLVLDEPSTGLDPAARRDIWQDLARLRSERGTTVIVTTHLMDEAAACDRVAHPRPGAARGARSAGRADGGDWRRRGAGDGASAGPAGTADSRAVRRAPSNWWTAGCESSATARTNSSPIWWSRSPARSTPSRSAGRRWRTCSCTTPVTGWSEHALPAARRWCFLS